MVRKCAGCGIRWLERLVTTEAVRIQDTLATVSSLPTAQMLEEQCSVVSTNWPVGTL